MKIVKILIGLASCYFLLRWLGGGSAPTGVIVAAVLALIVAISFVQRVSPAMFGLRDPDGNVLLIVGA